MPKNTSGWLVKATCEGHGNSGRIFNLPPQKLDRGAEGNPGYHELVGELAETFDLIPASVMLFSVHQGTKLSVHLGSQGDLDVVLAETMESGSHVIYVSVSGIPARRALDALGALAVAAATVAQLVYLWWLVTLSGATFYRQLIMWSVMIATLLINLGVFFYLLDDECDKHHAFRLWARPLHRRILMLLFAPFTGDVLPLVACKVRCARAHTRTHAHVHVHVLRNARAHAHARAARCLSVPGLGCGRAADASILGVCACVRVAGARRAASTRHSARRRATAW